MMIVTILPVGFVPLAVPLLGQVDKAPAQAAWIGIAVAIFLVVCAGVVSIISSKRGHQD
jgi:hypothetical protein